MRSTLAVCMIFGISLFMAPFHAGAQAKSQQQMLAQQSQTTWLRLSDSGKYAESQQESGAYFHAHNTKDKWVNAMKANRAPLGKMISRTLTSARFTKTLPGTADGQYYVMMYDTRFEHRPSAVETVTSMLELDGDWRVAGYFLK